jgi:hypothetical protein
MITAAHWHDGKIGPQKSTAGFSVITRSEATKQSIFPAAKWIASRSLASGAHSRDPLARNDDKGSAATPHVSDHQAVVVIHVGRRISARSLPRWCGSGSVA